MSNIKNLNPWLYNNKEIFSLSDLPEAKGMYGFVYLTTHIPTGTKYIGKKIFFHKIKRKLTKKDLKEYEGKRGRKPKYKTLIKESDWVDYYGSSSYILGKLNENKHHEFKREIILLAPTKRKLTYYEVKYQFKEEVLENPEYLNNNILGTFYKKDFENLNES